MGNSHDPTSVFKESIFDIILECHVKSLTGQWVGVQFWKVDQFSQEVYCGVYVRLSRIPLTLQDL